MKRLLAYASSLVLAIGPVLAQVPETAEDFRATYGVNSSLDNIIHYAINPALRALSGGGTAGGLACDDVTDDGPKLQAALNASHGSRVYLPPNASCRIKTYVSIPSHVYLVGQNTNLNFDPAATHSGSQNVTMMADGTSVNPIVDVTIDGVVFNGPGTASINDRVKIATNYAQNWKIIFSTFKNFGNTTDSTTRSTTYGHGLQFFNASDVLLYHNLATNNVGDGLSFSNNTNRVRIIDNTATLNWDSQIVPCTIGGNDIVTSGNTMIAPTGTATPPLVIDECTNTETVNNNITAPTSNWCILMERVQSNALINQDNKVIGNTCNGSMITISGAGTTQGTNTVTRGGMIKVIGNTVINSNSKGIYLSDSTSVTVTGNHIANAAAEGIAEESFGSPVGNNIISNNIVDGAQRCLRQVNSGGTVLPSIWTNNILKGCSVKTIDLLTVNVGGNSTNSLGFSADGTTDNCATLNAALAADDVTLPAGTGTNYYRSSCTIVVPFGRTLRGSGRTTAPGIARIGGTQIVCDAAVSPCIQIGQGNLNQMASMYNIYQGRAGGVPASTTIGVWVFGGENDALVDVQSDNNGINFLWGRSTIGAGAGLSHTGTRLDSYRAVDAHMVFDGIPDVRISDSHIGSVASDYNTQAAFRFTCTQHNCSGAGATNTINIVNTQVNQAAHRIECFAEFKDADPSFAGDYGEFHFDNIHAEVLGHGICSDSSWKSISALVISNSFITSALTTAEGPGGKFLNLNPVTKIDRWRIMGSELFASDEGGIQAFRFNPSGTGGGIYELKILGSTIYGNFYITGFNASSAQILGSTFTGTYTADGGWSYYTEVGDNVLGTYTENITPTVSAAIFNNKETRIGTTLGVTCASVNAATLTSSNGLITHC